LVTSDGQAKLLDFGIAKLLAPPDTPIEQDETLTHAQMMTPRYASPEQLRGEPIATASDVYSLGVVLYELLTGRSPYRFTSRSPIEIAREVIETEPDRPSDALLRPATGDEARGKSSEKLRRQLAGDLDNMVLKALRKEKERRYSSVQELSEDIRRYLEGRPVSARRDTFRYLASKFIARNKFATAAAALFVLALIAGILTTAWQARVARAEKDRAERRFNDVRKLARSVVFDYHDRIVDLPGSTPVREILIRDALEYLGSLAREATGDSSLQIELADAYEKISSVQGGAGSANIGDTPGAIESRRKAIEIRESLLAFNPENENLRVSLSTSYSILAGLLSETEDVEGALDNFAKAIRIAESLIGEDPQRIENRFLLAGNLGEMAAFLIYLGKWDGAKENARRSLEIYQSLVADNPQHQLHRRELSLAYERAAQIMLYTDDMEGALANQRKAVEIRESLANQFPERRDYKSLLGAGYYYLGDVQRSIAIVLKRKEYLSQSLDSYRKSAAIGEQLAADDPMNAQHLTSNVDISIGSVLEEMGRFADASASYRKAL
ncbi:MAG TPA: tetratricopeptide repeat-containing protein kinase family protein, partial [Blastocatellia bacterium]